VRDERGFAGLVFSVVTACGGVNLPRVVWAMGGPVWQDLNSKTGGATFPDDAHPSAGPVSMAERRAVASRLAGVLARPTTTDAHTGVVGDIRGVPSAVWIRWGIPADAVPVALAAAGAAAAQVARAVGRGGRSFGTRDQPVRSRPGSSYAGSMRGDSDGNERDRRAVADARPEVPSPPPSPNRSCNSFHTCSGSQHSVGAGPGGSRRSRSRSRSPSSKRTTAPHATSVRGLRRR
jgi:hypothetical protein